MLNNNTFLVDSPEKSLGFLLWQTTISWQRQIRDLLEPYEISQPQFVIMAILLWYEEQQVRINQVTIVNMSKLDKMTVSASLKKLVAQGYILRQEIKEDTRSKCVTLTSTGKDFIRKLIPQVENIDAEFFGKLVSSDQKVLGRILKNLDPDNFLEGALKG